MGKHEFPPFLMVVERGRLVPATPYDAERLGTWNSGAKVNVVFVRNGSRPLERKWFAILGLVVKQCAVPWTSKDEASEAIKLALGYVNVTKTVGGAWMQYPKSLTELTDPELGEAVEQMLALVQRMTGVDPETLRKEAPDAGDEEIETSATPADAAAVEANPPAPTVAADESLSQESGTGAGGTVAREEPVAPSAPATDLRDRNLMQEAIDKFLYTATDTKLPDPKDRQDALVACKNIWKEELKAVPDFVKACTDTANKVVKGTLTADDARQYLEALLPSRSLAGKGA